MEIYFPAMRVFSMFRPTFSQCQHYGEKMHDVMLKIETYVNDPDSRESYRGQTVELTNDRVKDGADNAPRAARPVTHRSSPDQGLNQHQAMMPQAHAAWVES